MSLKEGCPYSGMSFRNGLTAFSYLTMYLLTKIHNFNAAQNIPPLKPIVEPCFNGCYEKGQCFVMGTCFNPMLIL